MDESGKQHFAFDLDDTLTDSYQFNQQMFVETFIPYLDIKQSETDGYLRELHLNQKGTSMISQFSTAVKHFSLKINPADLVRENENLHLKNFDKINIFDAAEDVIKVIKANGKRISLFSNRQMGSLDKLLTKHHLKEYFDNVISCGDAGHEKPDPYCLIDLIDKSGEPKENFIFFGDSKTDSQFATAAGIDFLIIDHYINQKKFYRLILESFL